ncbi:purine nucleoside permease [Vararia minispora EC-137]|uniref:Purine nucleoside permease n=1 Tax=Vararia minispora EC-137 TaxID=1314806 RepID=A0ACB8Q9C5_9AGAM|nr:purine nucleoside permease [Vararia minispora EC-137]
MVTLVVGQVAGTLLSPKVFIIDFFTSEASVWYGIPEFNLLARNISVPGLSPLFPTVHCTQDGIVCQVITGEAEINAASTITALYLSPSFNLQKTYFLLAGIAGISPRMATLGSVTFARFSVQVALQFEFDAREKPSNSFTGYIPQGATSPDQCPTIIYGTEVFQLNDALRQRAIAFAKTAKLNDTASAQAYRAKYKPNPQFAAAVAPPSIVACDSATSDNFWTGNFLAQAFENTVMVFTNGSGTYCTTQQEDNGVLEALLRGALAGRVDFGRIIEMRTGSDFDRPAPGMTAADNLFNGADAGFEAALLNIHTAGVKVIEGIIMNWASTFAAGIPPTNNIGDVFGSLGGEPLLGARDQVALSRRSRIPSSVLVRL